MRYLKTNVCFSDYTDLRCKTAHNYGFYCLSQRVKNPFLTIQFEITKNQTSKNNPLLIALIFLINSASFPLLFVTNVRLVTKCLSLL